MSAGLIELLEGDATAAEGWLRPAYEGFRAHGLGVAAARAAALLGRALLVQGRAAEAETASHESEALAGDDFKAAIAWRGVRAEALTLRGEHAAGVELARAAVEIAAATDDLLDHADARSALAVALRAAGRTREADAEEARAIELWEQKGATLLAERARRGAARAAPAEPVPEARVAPERPARRRVRENAATANVRGVVAAVLARNADAFAFLIADNAVSVDHSTGAELDRPRMLRSWRSFLSAEDFTFASEPFATLGDMLALCRNSTSARGVARGDFDVGAYDTEAIVLVEVDAEGRRRRMEAFAANRLGDALARLYGRYAELLPDGPERARAAATARAVGQFLGPFDLARYAAAFAPAIEVADHRILGTWSAHGAEAALLHFRSLLEVADDISLHEYDVLCLEPDAFLVGRIHRGTDRASGGAYERQFLMVLAFGSDGLMTCIEWFDSDRDAEALARFDALTAEPSAAPSIRRRVRPNAATATLARLDAAIAARDGDAIADLYADSAEIVHHPTGITYDRQGALASWRSLLGARDPTQRSEPLAILGDSLALGRQSTSASSLTTRTLDIGAYEAEKIVLIEVDAGGRIRRGEVFAADRLGDAVARLYERYAELLPEGPEKTRAEAIARSAPVLGGPTDLARFRVALSPDVEFQDHRTLGLASARGSELMLGVLASLLEMAPDSTNRIDDVLALTSDAFLVRVTNLGTSSIGGGAYERPFLVMWTFGADGLIARSEQFDIGREAEALARFGELTAEPQPARPVRRRVRPNAATANSARFEAALAARDGDALPALWADCFDVVDHQTGVQYDRQGSLATWRAALRIHDFRYRQKPLGTLGASLLLLRQSESGSSGGGRLDVGPFERDEVVVLETDSEGRRRRSEIFSLVHLGDAIARLYERYAELLPEGPEKRVPRRRRTRPQPIWDRGTPIATRRRSHPASRSSTTGPWGPGLRVGWKERSRTSEPGACSATTTPCD